MQDIRFKISWSFFKMESEIQDTIEVFLGDEEDPATYWMILKSDLPRVNKIGKV